jgi:hypothetical protein
VDELLHALHVDELELVGQRTKVVVAEFVALDGDGQELLFQAVENPCTVVPNFTWSSVSLIPASFISANFSMMSQHPAQLPRTEKSPPAPHPMGRCGQAKPRLREHLDSETL